MLKQNQNQRKVGFLASQWKGKLGKRVWIPHDEDAKEKTTWALVRYYFKDKVGIQEKIWYYETEINLVCSPTHPVIPYQFGRKAVQLYVSFLD